MADDAAVLRRVADHILGHTEFALTADNQAVTDSGNMPMRKGYRIESPYLQWQYWNGVLYDGMQGAGEALDEPAYRDYGNKAFEFLHSWLDYHRTARGKGMGIRALHNYDRFKMLDDCGAMAAALVDVYREDPAPRYLEYLERTADYILNEEHRLDDGTLARTFPHDRTVWLDDLYMSLSFITRMGGLTGDERYFDFATRQVRQFTDLLYDPSTQLYNHCWYHSLEATGSVHWSRANGWATLSLVNLLEHLPEDHPAREEMLQIFRRHIRGLARYQSSTGLWRQILDRGDSYLETSGSAMFTYGIAKGINHGWLDPLYRDVALAGWEGIQTQIRADGQVEGICKGTGISTSPVYYHNRPTPLNDIHGIGAVLLAGQEIIKLKQQHDDYTSWDWRD